MCEIRTTIQSTRSKRQYKVLCIDAFPDYLICRIVTMGSLFKACIFVDYSGHNLSSQWRLRHLHSRDTIVRLKAHYARGILSCNKAIIAFWDLTSFLLMSRWEKANNILYTYIGTNVVYKFLRKNCWDL